MGNPPEMQLRVGWASDVGRVREHNEDACLADPTHGLFIVSDGMGGQQAGALASQIVVQVLPEMIKLRLPRAPRVPAEQIRRSLRESIGEISRGVCSQSTGTPGLQGMGATVVLALVRGHTAHLAHMGDSRAYILRDGHLQQLTEDHSVVGLLLRLKQITAREAAVHPARGQLSRHLGMEGNPLPEARSVRLKNSDRLLLCSDGLTGMLTDKEIGRILKLAPEPDVACRALVDAANQAGGRDNVTVVIVVFGQANSGSTVRAL